MTNYPFLHRDTDSCTGKISLLRLAPQPLTHQHAYFELIYVLQGTAVRKLPEGDIPARAGDYYLIPPYHVHGYADLQNFEVVSCIFTADHFDWAFPDEPSIAAALSTPTTNNTQLSNSIAAQTFHDSDGIVRQFILKMEKEHANCYAGYMEVLRCYLTQILVHIYRAFEPRSPHNGIAQVMEFLTTHYAEQISLDAICQVVGYTPQYMSRLFHAEVGMSMKTFLQCYRIEQACALLSHTNLSTAEVAAAVGYQDVRHFSKLFRRYRKMSPTKYRQSAMQ